MKQLIVILALVILPLQTLCEEATCVQTLAPTEVSKYVLEDVVFKGMSVDTLHYTKLINSWSIPPQTSFTDSLVTYRQNGNMIIRTSKILGNGYGYNVPFMWFEVFTAAIIVWIMLRKRSTLLQAALFSACAILLLCACPMITVNFRDDPETALGATLVVVLGFLGLMAWLNILTRNLAFNSEPVNSAHMTGVIQIFLLTLVNMFTCMLVGFKNLRVPWELSALEGSAKIIALAFLLGIILRLVFIRPKKSSYDLAQSAGGSV